MSLGQAGGAVGGAVIGALLAPVTGGASVAFGLTSAQISGAFLGLSIGAAIGGVIDPPETRQPRAQHEIQDVQYNTFSHDLPVPILFGKGRWFGNVIFIGNTYGQVETTGSQTVGEGKAKQQQNIEEVIYYADFVIGLGEGEFRRIIKVFREDTDISDQEGQLYEKSLGASTEAVPEIVTTSPKPISRPIAWVNTAKLIYSGRIGKVNRLPRIGVLAEGPDLSVTQSDTALTGMPSAVETFIYDDISQWIVAVTGNSTIAFFTRTGDEQESATLPVSGTDYNIDRAFYNGRIGNLFVFCDSTSAKRHFMIGQPGYDASDNWQISQVEHVAFVNQGISRFNIDESNGVVWVVAIDSSQLYLGSWSFDDGQETVYEIPLSNPGGSIIKGYFYDKIERLHYVLYTEGGALYMTRFDHEDIGDSMETMVVLYGFNTPEYLFKTGELFGVWDTGTNARIHYFEWGYTGYRERFGGGSDAATFDPTRIEGLEFWLDAGNSEMTGAYSDTDPVPLWYDESGLDRDAVETNATRQPTFRTNRVNSLPALTFDGTAQRMRILEEAGARLEREDMTLFIVMKSSSTSIDGDRLAFSGWVKNQNIVKWHLGIDYDAANGDTIFDYEYNTTMWQEAYTTGSWEVWSIVGKPTGDTAYKDGTLFAAGTHTQGGITDFEFGIGCYVRDASRLFEGEIALIGAFDRVLDDEERQQIELHLREKFQINPPGSTTFDSGVKGVYHSPQDIFYSDAMSQLMVLDDETAVGGDWIIKMSHWNGDNWSYINETSYVRRLFEEESTCPGAVYALFANARYGAGMPVRFIGEIDAERASGYCNQPIDMQAYEGFPVDYAPRYQLNYLLATKRNLSQVVQELLTAFNAFIVYSEGKLKLKIDKDNGIIDGYFGDGTNGSPDNIVADSFQYNEIPRDDRVNQVYVEFLDENNEYRKTPVPATADWDNDLYQEQRQTTMNVLGCTRARQASNIGIIRILGSTLRLWVCQFTTSTYALRNEVGDVIAVTHGDPQWIEKPMRIVGMSEAESDEITISCIEHIEGLDIVNTHPMQTPQRLEQLAGADTTYDGDPSADVMPPTRVEVVEDVDTGRLILLASKPFNAGPWSIVRWHGQWDPTTTPGATVYPGSTQFDDTEFTYIIATTVFTPSGLLKDTITNGATTIPIDAISGEPPQYDFLVLIVNDDLTATDMGVPTAPATSGPFYERVEGSIFNDTTKEITAETRGFGTPAQTHTVTPILVGAVAHANENVNGGTPVTTFERDGSTVHWGPHIYRDALDAEDDILYIGFDETDFLANGAPNNIRWTLSGNIASGSPTGVVELEWYYSDGDGTWTKFENLVDGTNGLNVDGMISWDAPDDWFATDYWEPGNKFDEHQNFGTGDINNKQYWVKVIRKSPASPVYGYINNPNVSDMYGYKSPKVYFLKSGFPVYDFDPVEQGYTLKFKAQPVGIQGQSILLEDLTEVSHEIGNIAGEGI